MLGKGALRSWTPKIFPSELVADGQRLLACHPFLAGAFPLPKEGDAAFSHPYMRPDSWRTGQTRLITRNLFQQELA